MISSQTALHIPQLGRPPLSQVQDIHFMKHNPQKRNVANFVFQATGMEDQHLSWTEAVFRERASSNWWHMSFMLCVNTVWSKNVYFTDFFKTKLLLFKLIDLKMIYCQLFQQLSGKINIILIATIVVLFTIAKKHATWEHIDTFLSSQSRCCFRNLKHYLRGHGDVLETWATRCAKAYVQPPKICHSVNYQLHRTMERKKHVEMILGLGI